MTHPPLIPSRFLLPVLSAGLLLSPETAWCFHTGGAGECDGCHTIHGIERGVPSITPGPYLLRGSDSGSVCLNCHEQNNDVGPTGYHISTPSAEMPTGIPPKQLTPAGDFGWLKKNYTWIPAFGSAAEQSIGDSHGHNISAFDYGYLPDVLLTAAPSGSYPSTSLTCISCHDPHGRYRRNQDGSITTTGTPIKDSGSLLSSPLPDATASVGSYRMLGGTGYAPKSVGNAYAFVNRPPDAVAPDLYNRSESSGMTRVAYGYGMSEWCMNCHPTMHNGDGDPLQHPSGQVNGLLSQSNITDYYNSYVKTGDLTGGTEATAYLSLVPFEIGTSNYAIMKSILSTTPLKGPSGADGSPQVMCLSCHRAHASGWDDMTRWNTRSEYVVSNGAYSEEGSTYQPYGQGRSEAEALRAYYDIPATTFALQQTTLCFKCHESMP